MLHVWTKPPLLSTKTVPTSTPRVNTWSVSVKSAKGSFTVIVKVTFTLPPVLLPKIVYEMADWFDDGVPVMTPLLN